MAQRVILSEPNLPSTAISSGRESGAHLPSIRCFCLLTRSAVERIQRTTRHQGVLRVLLASPPASEAGTALKNTNGSEILSPSQIFCHTDRELSGTKIKAPGVGVANLIYKG